MSRPKTEPYLMTISEASSLIDSKELSPVELVDSVLSRIAATEPVLHAYVRVDPERARSDAREAERQIWKGRRKGPLHGVPVALKDVFDVAGIPTEAGSRTTRHYVPARGSSVAEKLRMAGAILLGKTVTHELAYGLNVPPTRNPWHGGSYPGGSSAGSAVAVAVDSAMGALGTDTGGSVRLPASINGIVGLKPTFGRISRYGVVPLSTTLDHCGLLSKTVEDAALLLNVTAGFDRRDPASLRAPSIDFTGALARPITGTILGIERDYFLYDRVSPAVRQSTEEAIRVLIELGATIRDIKIPALSWAPAVGITIVMAEASAHHQKWLRERAGDYSPDTRRMLLLGELILATDYLRACQARKQLVVAVSNAFTDNKLDALITPTLPSTTVAQEQLNAGGLNSPLQSFVHHMMPFNLTGQPAITVPAGFDASGLPIGIQLVGRPLNEVMITRIGHAYESATAWHHETPNLDSVVSASSIATSTEMGARGAVSSDRVTCDER